MGSFPRLTPDQLDLSVTQYDFTQSLTDTLGSLGSDQDGFDPEVNDLVLLLSSAGDPGAPIDDDLGLAGSIANSIDVNSLVGDEASLPASLAEGDSILSDAAHLVGTVQPVPAPPSGGDGGTGGTPAPSLDCGQRTNKYGLSKQGAFPGVVCDQHLNFQVLRAQDGPCTYHADIPPSAGFQTPPKVVSFTLIQGDPAVWTLGKSTEPVRDGSLLDVYTVKITPVLNGQTSSHYGVGLLVSSGPSRTQRLCMSVDVIP